MEKSEKPFTGNIRQTEKFKKNVRKYIWEKSIKKNVCYKRLLRMYNNAKETKIENTYKKIERNNKKERLHNFSVLANVCVF